MQNLTSVFIPDLPPHPAPIGNVSLFCFQLCSHQHLGFGCFSKKQETGFVSTNPSVSSGPTGNDPQSPKRAQHVRDVLPRPLVP